jgi:hypothetical protein
VEQVQANKQKWFSRGLDSSVIDEYFKRSVIPSSVHGSILRLRVVNDIVPLLGPTIPTHHVDIVLQCRGLRFFKHCFAPEWSITSVTKVQPTFLNSVLEDEDEDDQYHQEFTDEDGIANTPDPEQLLSIVSEMKSKALEMSREIEPKLKFLTDRMQRLTKINELEIKSTKDVSLQLVDDLAEELDRLSADSDET